ncbi:MAG: hypothetical protein WD208_12670 [Dehalococcoidia bacterium]
MNRHQLAREFDQLHGKYRDRVSFEQAIPWLLGGLGFLQPLLPNDFTNFLDIDSGIWKGASVGVAMFLFFMGFRALYLAFRSWRTPISTTDETMRRLLRDMPPRDRGGAVTPTPQPPQVPENEEDPPPEAQEVNPEK